MLRLEFLMKIVMKKKTSRNGSLNMEFLLIVVGQQLNSYRSFNCLVGHAQIAALSLLLQLNLSDSFTFEMVAPKFQCGTFLFVGVCGHKMCIRSVENHNILLFVQLSFAPFWNYKWFATHIYMYIYELQALYLIQSASDTSLRFHEITASPEQTNKKYHILHSMRKCHAYAMSLHAGGKKGKTNGLSATIHVCHYAFRMRR